MSIETPHDPYGLHRHDEQGRELVGCDRRDCMALQEPQTIEEYKIALEHCEEHAWMSGCSHGC